MDLVVFGLIGLVGFLDPLHEVLEDGHGVLKQRVVHARHLLVEALDVPSEARLFRLKGG